jgi:hypothetical protein
MNPPSFATHYYLPEAGPFRSLSDLPQGGNNPVFLELLTRHKHIPVYRRRFGVDYIEVRRRVESELKELFIARGGKPKRSTPYYLTLGECPWFKGLNDEHQELKVDLAQLNPETTSLTFPDSFIAMSRQDKPYYKKLFLLSEVQDLWSSFSLPRNPADVPYEDYWKSEFEIYAEVQVWEELRK